MPSENTGTLTSTIANFAAVHFYVAIISGLYVMATSKHNWLVNGYFIDGVNVPRVTCRWNLCLPYRRGQMKTYTNKSIARRIRELEIYAI